MKSAKKVRGERGNRTHQVSWAGYIRLTRQSCASLYLKQSILTNQLFYTLNLNDCINMRKTISLPTLPSQAIGINIYLHEKLLSMKLNE